MTSKLGARICDLLGIEYPVIGAGMGNVSGPQLAAAISNAGGLGVLGLTFLEPEQIRDWIKMTRDLTDKPFGADLLIPGGVVDDKAGVPAEQAAFVDKIKKELNIHPAQKGAWSGGSFNLNESHVRRQFEVILEEDVPVYCSGLGSPDWVVSGAREKKMKVISLIGNVKSAIQVAERGTDIIVAQGTEAGGHTGRVGTMALVPQVVDAVSPIPVLAAGGIGDGRGLAASLALGADGVWVGTRFVATKEAVIDCIGIGGFWPASKESIEYYKQQITKASEDDTMTSKVFTGKPLRTISNKLSVAWAKSGIPTLPMPLQSMAITDLMEGMISAKIFDHMVLPAGQITGMIKELKSVKEIIDEMMETAAAILK